MLADSEMIISVVTRTSPGVNATLFIQTAPILLRRYNAPLWPSIATRSQFWLKNMFIAVPLLDTKSIVNVRADRICTADTVTSGLVDFHTVDQNSHDLWSFFFCKGCTESLISTATSLCLSYALQLNGSFERTISSCSNDKLRLYSKSCVEWYERVWW